MINVLFGSTKRKEKKKKTMQDKCSPFGRSENVIPTTFYD